MLGGDLAVMDRYRATEYFAVAIFQILFVFLAVMPGIRSMDIPRAWKPTTMIAKIL